MSGCEDCRQEPIDPLIGREAWRQARLADATGPTGPTGVVHDMRSATGSFDALVDSSLCSCSVPGLVATATFGFTNASTNFLANIASFPYRDGVVALTTLAAGDLSDGVWIKADAVPLLDLPTDSVTRGPLPFVLTDLEAAATPNFTESSTYVYAEHGMWFVSENVLNYISAAMAEANEPEYYSGPIRITAGYGTTIVHDAYSLNPAIWVPSVRVRESNVALATLPYVVEPSSSPRRISTLASVAGQTFSFPVQLPQDFILGGVNNGISLQYDTARMQVRQEINQQTVRGPTISAVSKPVIKENRTDVIVPAAVTGPTGVALPVTAGAVHLDSFYQTRNANLYLTDRTSVSLSPAFANARLVGRPDEHDQQACYALNGPTWHERNLIRYGSDLGLDSSRHKFRLTFDWQPPDPSEYVSFFNRRFTIGVTDHEWSVTAGITFAVLGGTEIELTPIIQGRHLMPGMYALGPTELDDTEITTVPGFIQSSAVESPVPATESASIVIKPILHAFATSSVRALQPPSNAPPSYTTLPLPGDQGMGLDDYTIWSPTIAPGFFTVGVNWPRAKQTAAGRLSIGLQAWFKITATSVGLVPPWSGNRVVYRRLATPEIVLDLSDEQCNALSDGDEISASSTSGDPYKIQFSIYEP
jgi:hypothetical protein